MERWHSKRKAQKNQRRFDFRKPCSEGEDRSGQLYGRSGGYHGRRQQLGDSSSRCGIEYSFSSNRQSDPLQDCPHILERPIYLQRKLKHSAGRPIQRIRSPCQFQSNPQCTISIHIFRTLAKMRVPVAHNLHWPFVKRSQQDCACLRLVHHHEWLTI